MARLIRDVLRGFYRGDGFFLAAERRLRKSERVTGTRTADARCQDAVDQQIGRIHAGDRFGEAHLEVG